MARGRRPPGGSLPIAFQIAKMLQRFPDFRYRRGEGAWYGHLQPTAESPNYLVRVRYQPGAVPKVWVVRPAPVPEARTLHRYPDGSLCLYHPDDGDWHGRRYLADTIVPWAAEWLFYYECWLLDPERRWRGPEAPHGNTEVKARTSASAGELLRRQEAQ